MAIFPIVQESLGVSENAENSLFDIFPNPSGGIYTIWFKENTINPVSVEIFNSTGVLVEQLIFESGQAYKLDLTGQPSGLYFVRISEDGNVYSKKIIKE
jgi:hypothetical protein